MGERTPRRTHGWQDSTLGGLAVGGTAVGIAAGALAVLRGTTGPVAAAGFTALLVGAAAAGTYARGTGRRPPRLPAAVRSSAVLALVGLVALTVWTATGPGADRPTGDPAAAPTGPSPAGCDPLHTKADIRPGRDTAPVELVEASYTMTPETEPVLQWAGRMRGPVEPGTELYLVGTADPATRDSTADRNYAGDGYFVLFPLILDATGCWRSEPRRLYACAGGVTFRYKVVRVELERGRRIVADQQADERLRDHGYSPPEVNDLPLTWLEEFDVDTTAAKCT